MNTLALYPVTSINVWRMSVSLKTSVRANEKPWMTAEVRSLLNVRNTAFKYGDEAALRFARANLNKAIRVAKRAFSQKIQDHFRDHRNTRRLWQGIQAATDWKSSPLSCNDNTEFLNNLNDYCDRFDALDNTPAVTVTPHQDEQVLTLDPGDVLKSCYKTSAIIPVPNKSSITCLNYYRPFCLPPLTRINLRTALQRM